MIARIAALYRIEDAIRGRPPDERVAVRQRESRPKVEALKVYLETQLGRISGKSTLATAIRYALNHGLCVFLSDVEIDTNTIERLHRSIATGRRNALFAGSDAGARSWAIFTSLIQSALCRIRHRALYAERRTMPSGAVRAGRGGVAVPPARCSALLSLGIV